MSYGRLAPGALEEVVQDELQCFQLPVDWREQRTQVNGFAIDSPSTKDVDDAVYIEQEENTTALLVSIADVASFLSQPSAIRTQARRRGWTKYAGNRVHRPMLPKSVSEDLLSLKDNEERPAINLRFPVDANGSIGELQVTKAVIRAKRLSYDHVDTFLSFAGDQEDNDSRTISGLQDISKKLFKARIRSGAQVLERDSLSRNAEQLRSATFIVREAMIATNIAVARFFVANAIPGLFRIFSKDSLAQYSSAPRNHDALGLPDYMHSTSPLRRFADFACQANLLAFLEEREFPYSEQKLGHVAVRLNEMQKEGPAKPRTNRPQKKPEKSAMTLLERLESADVKIPDLLAAIFTSEPDSELDKKHKQLAMAYLAANPEMSRQVINTAAMRGELTIRAATAEDAVQVTRKVIEDSKGNVYPFYKNINKSSRETDYVLRGKQIAEDTRALGRIANVAVEPEIPFYMTAPYARQVRDASSLLSAFHKEKPMGLQFNHSTNSAGETVASVFMLENGRVIEASDTHANKEVARDLAAYTLMLEMDYYDNPPVVLNAPALKHLKVEI